MVTTSWTTAIGSLLASVAAFGPLLLGGSCLTMATGCDGLVSEHVKQMDVLRGLAADVSDRMADGGYGQFAANGQALEPGVTVAASVTYSASAFYKGLAGQYSVSAQGELGERSNQNMTATILQDQSLSDAAKLELIANLLSPADNVPPE